MCGSGGEQEVPFSPVIRLASTRWQYYICPFYQRKQKHPASFSLFFPNFFLLVQTRRSVESPWQNQIQNYRTPLFTPESKVPLGALILRHEKSRDPIGLINRTQTVGVDRDTFQQMSRGTRAIWIRKKEKVASQEQRTGPLVSIWVLMQMMAGNMCRKVA